MPSFWKKNSGGHVRIVPEKTCVKLQVCTLTILELLAFNPPKFRGLVTVATPPFWKKLRVISVLSIRTCTQNYKTVTSTVFKLLCVSGLQITLYTPDLDLGRNWPISRSRRSFLYCFLSVVYLVYLQISLLGKSNMTASVILKIGSALFSFVVKFRNRFDLISTIGQTFRHATWR